MRTNFKGLVISTDSRFALYSLKYLSILFTVICSIFVIMGDPISIRLGAFFKSGLSFNIINSETYHNLPVVVLVIFVLIIINVGTIKIVNKYLKNTVENVTDFGRFIEITRNQIRYKIDFSEINSIESLENWSPAKIRICLNEDKGFGKIFEFTSKPTNFWNANDTSKVSQSLKSRLKR